MDKDVRYLVQIGWSRRGGTNPGQSRLLLHVEPQAHAQLLPVCLLVCLLALPLQSSSGVTR